LNSFFFFSFFFFFFLFFFSFFSSSSSSSYSSSSPSSSSSSSSYSSSSSSSSYCWASVANAPNILQPYWLYENLAARNGIIYRPKDVPTLSNQFRAATLPKPRKLSLWAYNFKFLPTFATSRLQEILTAKGGTMWI
jgi:hypothetical protein